MNCRRTEELIPLYVGGDLDTNTSQTVRDHLASCNDCAMLASRFDESQRWLAGATPKFEDALFADMKRGVMREIGSLESRRGARYWLMRSVGPIFERRPLLAAAAVLVALAAGILLLYSSRAALTKPDQLRAREQQPAPETPDGGGTKDSSDGATAASHHRHHRYRIRTKHHADVSAEQLAVQKATGNDISEVSAQPDGGEDRMLRIEIQTSDPNIRIIWFAPKETETQTRPATDFE